MRTIFTIFIIALLMVLITGSTHAQWEQAEYLSGYLINTLAVVDSHVFVGCGNDRIFLSSDNGTSWAAANDGMPATFVITLAAMGTKLFAGSVDGVFMSTNFGASWTSRNYGLPGPLQVEALQVSGTNLFAGTWGRGIFLLTENDSGWRAINEGLPKRNYDTSSYIGVSSFVVSGATLFAGTEAGVFRSTDNGTHWTAVNAGMKHHVWALTTSPNGEGGTNLFAGTAAGVFRSTDNGITWTNPGVGMPATEVRALTMCGANLFAGTYDGILSSSDNGASWTAVNAESPAHGVYAFAVIGSDFYAGTGGGVAHSNDDGVSWTMLGPWMHGTLGSDDVGSFAVTDANIFYLGRGDFGAGLFVSSDHGTSWSYVAYIPIGGIGFFNRGLTKLTSNGEHLFFGDRHGLWRSTDSGITWDMPTVDSVESSVRALTFLGPSGGQNLYAGAYWRSDTSIDYSFGVYRSTDNGDTWTKMSSQRVDVFGSNGSTLFSGVGRDYPAQTDVGVFRSTDNGSSWAAVNTGLTDSIVSCFVANTSFLFAGTAHGVFRTTDNGTSWSATSLTNAVHAFAVSGGNLFAGTNSGVFLSTNNGTDWVNVSVGLTDTIISDLGVHGSYLFACASPAYGFHVWRRPLSEMIHEPPVSNGWVHTALDSINVTCFEVRANNLFVGTSSDGVFRSTNNGTSWDAANSGLFYDSTYQRYWPIMVLAASSTHLFAGEYAGAFMFLSTDNGTSWSGGGRPDGGWVLSLAVLPKGIDSAYLFAGTANDATSGDGVYISTDNGTSWTQRGLGGTVPFIVASGSNLFAQSNNLLGTGFLAMSTDKGANWERIDSSWQRASCLAVVDNKVFVGRSDGVKLSTNNGSTWTAINTGLPVDSTFVYHGGVRSFATTNMNVFAGTAHGVFLTTNNGSNWIEVNGGLTDSVITALAVSDSFLFAGTGSGVWRRPLSEMVNATTQQFTTGWNLISLPQAYTNSHADLIYPGTASPPYDYCDGYAVCDSLEFGKGYWLKVGTSREFSHFGYPVLVETVTVVQGWNIIGSLSEPISVSSITSNPPGMVSSPFWAYDGTHYIHTDTIRPGRGHWVKVEQAGQLILSSSSGTMSAPNRIKIVATGEMPPAPPDGVAGVKESLRPTKYSLSQNYPNPFNPTTMIKYQLPNSNYVSLKVYDIIGREVATLVEGIEQAGYKSVNWDAGNMPSGIYFYRLSAGSFTQTRKLILLK